MSAAQPWISECSALTSGALSTDYAVLRQHAAQDVTPAAVCTPANVEQAAAVIRFAAAHGIAVLPFGGGTAQGIGTPPPPQALALSTHRLNLGFAHEPADIIATLPAGMTLGEAQTRLQANGQWLPLDGPAAATIGGLVATDRSGPLAHGYGTLRDMVIGMTVINGDGEIRKCGGKVVKNVTGYALDKLYIGSMGTLGLIVEVTFKLRPLPIARQQWTTPFDSLDAATAALRAIALKNLPLESLFVRQAGNESTRLFAAAAGTAAELDRIHSEISSGVAPRQPERSTASTQWHAAPVAHTLDAKGARLRFWCRASALNAVLPIVSPQAETFEFHTQGGWAELCCNETQAADIAAKLTAAGANLRFEDVHDLQLRERFGPPRADWTLMKQIRAALDPRGIMNPSRFIV